MHFITARAGRLYEGEEEFRFFSLAAPDLHHNESQLHPDGSNRWPDGFETRDLMASLSQMGGRVTRSFGLSVHISGEPDGHLKGPRQYSEEGFAAYDRAIALAGEMGVRLVFPFIDSHSFPNVRGIDEFSAWRGKKGIEFWTDPELKEDYKQLMHDILNRRNTVNGLLYKDDPAILAWQLGNELDSYFPDRGMGWEEGLDALTPWSLEMAAFLKTEDKRHLVMEAGGHREAYLDDPNIDILSDHYYEYWNRLFGKPYDLAPIHLESMERIAGRKPLIVDEFGLAEMENLTRLMDAITQSGCSGGLLWSIRSHRRDGGFYCHNEGGTNVNSYHWPGFDSGDEWHERETLHLLRRKAYEIQGIPLPPLPIPEGAPLLLSAEAGRLTWRGSTGASGYRIERRTPGGEWEVLAQGVSDSAIANVPDYEASGASEPPLLFEDPAPAASASYRVIGTNESGETEPSNILSGESLA